MHSRKSAALYICGCCLAQASAPPDDEAEVPCPYIEDPRLRSTVETRTTVTFQRSSVLRLALDFRRDGCLSTILESTGEALAVCKDSDELRSAFSSTPRRKPESTRLAESI